MTLNNNFSILETPCFILDEEHFLTSIRGFKEALDKYFPRNILGYSLKTNSLPALLERVNLSNCYAEVVSFDEYELAKKCSFPINRIIYNGPLKSKKTFLEAIENDAIVNIETKRELEWLSYLPKDKIYKVGVRLNVNLDLISPNDAKEGEGYSRFGYNEATGELNDFLSEIKELKNIRLSGLHIHRTSKTRSTEMYRNLSKWIVKIIHKYNLNLEYIDIGGGYYGIMKNKPTYLDYTKVIYDELKNEIDLNSTTIIIEPGNALVASSFSFLSTVIDTKNMGSYHICTTDGSRIDIDPFFHKTDYFKEFIYSSNKHRGKIQKQIIGGCTCLEYDKILSIKNDTELHIGDKILYKSVGAYTMTMTPLFIRYFPKVYSKKGDTYTLIREKWNSNDIIK